MMPLSPRYVGVLLMEGEGYYYGWYVNAARAAPAKCPLSPCGGVMSGNRSGEEAHCSGNMASNFSFLALTLI